MERVQFTTKETDYIQRRFQRLEEFETHNEVWSSEKEFNRRLNSLWVNVPRKKEQLHNLTHLLVKANRKFRGDDEVELFN